MGLPSDPSRCARPSPEARPIFRHYGVVFRCFLCRDEVGPVSQLYRNGHTGVRYFTCASEGGVELAPYGHDHVDFILQQINGPMCRLSLHDASNKQHCYVETCSKDEGHGVLCKVAVGQYGRLLHMAHQFCWNLATAGLEEDSPELKEREVQLTGMAHHTMTLPTRAEGRDAKNSMLFLLPSRVEKKGSLSSLSKLLMHISELPQELKDIIPERLEDSLVGTIFKTTRTVNLLLSQTASGVSMTSGYPCRALGPLQILSSPASSSTSYLSARLSDVLGETYLSGLIVQEIPVNAGAITSVSISQQKTVSALQVAVSAYGLRGVRVLYSDESMSPWVGNSGSCWLGAIHCISSTPYWVRSDSLRSIHLSHEDWLTSGPVVSAIKAVGAMATQFSYFIGLWDCDMRSHLRDNLATVLGRFRSRPRIIFFYQDARLCNFLSLVRGATYVSGITVYCSEAGLHGMKVRFPTGSSTFGEQKGHNVHFALAQGERLTSAWINVGATRSYELRHLLPPLLRGSDMVLAITTNHGRRYNFGPANMGNNGGTTRRDWACLSHRSPTEITGFIFDAVSYRLNHVFEEIGVTEKLANGFPPGQPMHTPEFTRKFLDNTYLLVDANTYQCPLFYHTWGTLDNVTNMRRQTSLLPTNNRIMGMQIEHHDGTVDTLGQWDPDHVGSISEF